MRVIEPPKNNNSIGITTRKKKVRSHKLTKFSVFFILMVIGIFFVTDKAQSPETVMNENPPAPITQEEVIEIDVSQKIYSGNEFRLLYDQLLQPNLDKVDIPPVITGNDIADTRIRQITETRGYKLRSSPTVDLQVIDGYLMQPLVEDSWAGLKAESRSEGIYFSVTSAYRSVDSQRQLFLSRLTARGVSYVDIANGRADEEINETLITTATPGYSKHHTGYTLDFLCAGYAFENFKNSNCYDWLSANNYEKAKKHGFIPSYPSDADLQGPDPEAWEYVWVGTDVIYPN